jgi:predicted nucleic acid-binding protein
MKAVIDTSALIAVLLGEKSRARIVELTYNTDLIAPASLHWEIGNAFSAMFKRSRLELSTAIEAIDRYQDIPIQFVEVDLREALRLSEELNVYAYDAYMLNVAKRHRVPLLTLDGGLQEAARRANIKLLEVTP